MSLSCLQEIICLSFIQVKELRLKLNQAETLNRGHAERLAKAARAATADPTSAPAGRLEVLMEQRDSLEAENAKLKKVRRLPKGQT